MLWHCLFSEIRNDQKNVKNIHAQNTGIKLDGDDTLPGFCYCFCLGINNKRNRIDKTFAERYNLEKEKNNLSESGRMSWKCEDTIAKGITKEMK